MTRDTIMTVKAASRPFGDAAAGSLAARGAFELSGNGG